MRLALLVSIPLALLTLSEVLSCAHREDMSLDMSEKSQLVPVRNSRLLEHNFLKTVGRTQIERSCKVYAGKTNWKTSWSLISRRCQMRTQRAIFVDFRTENGRSQNSRRLFLNIARRPRTTQSDLVFFNLSRASCMFGRNDIK